MVMIVSLDMEGGLEEQEGYDRDFHFSYECKEVFYQRRQVEREFWERKK
jgi:hypothetical protein